MAKDYVILIIQFVAHLPPVLTLWLQPQQQIFRAYQINPRPTAAPADLVLYNILHDIYNILYKQLLWLENTNAKY